MLKRTFIQIATSKQLKTEIKQLAKTHTNGNVTAFVLMAINEFKNKRDDTNRNSKG
jgi:hypothetical protein